MSNKKAYLKEMGVDVWIERNPSVSESSVVVEPATAKETFLPEIAVVESTAAPVKPVETFDIEKLDWRSLQAQISKCQLCELSQTRTQTVFGSGKQNADLMIIADDSNEQSGALLTAMLKAMGLQRSDVYISNIVKCDLPENKEPSDEQTNSCEPFLLRQISLLQPKLILALGIAAAQRLLKSKSTMNRLRGQLHYVDGINVPVLVSYHPTYLLAAPNEKRKAWQDLQIALKELQA